jgi:hypothetical protein
MGIDENKCQGGNMSGVNTQQQLSEETIAVLNAEWVRQIKSYEDFVRCGEFTEVQNSSEESLYQFFSQDSIRQDLEAFIPNLYFLQLFMEDTRVAKIRGPVLRSLNDSGYLARISPESYDQDLIVKKLNALNPHHGAQLAATSINLTARAYEASFSKLPVKMRAEYAIRSHRTLATGVAAGAVGAATAGIVIGSLVFAGICSTVMLPLIGVIGVLSFAGGAKVKEASIDEEDRVKEASYQVLKEAPPTMRTTYRNATTLRDAAIDKLDNEQEKLQSYGRD